MKHSFASAFVSVPAPQSVHRVNHGRFSNAKAHAHRHERRKVRAFLRHLDGVQDTEALPLLR